MRVKKHPILQEKVCRPPDRRQHGACGEQSHTDLRRECIDGAQAIEPPIEMAAGRRWGRAGASEANDMPHPPTVNRYRRCAGL